MDNKDKGLNRDFIASVSPNPFHKVSKELSRILTTTEIRGILFSGDLTSRGDKDSYDSCVKHFNKLLSLNTTPKGDIVHVVPGNHDIDRQKVFSENTDKMFDCYVEVWKKYNLDVLKPYEVRTKIETDGNSKVQFFSLNTCVGCGQTRVYPDVIKNIIDEHVKKVNLSDRDSFELFCERLDTPAAKQEHLDQLEDEIKIAKQNHIVPVVLAHHGLLPQSTIRTKIYAEVINGGQIRSMLENIQYPIIYCHGHIHQDPVEIVIKPRCEGSNLISISAPEFHDGFNVIDLHFGKTGIPIGCIIHPYRAQEFGSVNEEQIIKVPFNLYDTLDDYCDDDLKQVYKLLPSKEIRFNEIFKSVKKLNPNMSQTDLENILYQLEWLSVVRIDNLNRKSAYWIVRRVGL